MAASSSGSWRYDVFPSFSGEDVRKTFLSHLLKELDRRSINTFIDNGIVRSRPIAPELISAIRETRISIIIFSKNYASSTWCLNELVEIHNCYEELDQMVIPVFYDVDPSEVRKQTGEFGKVFKETCKNKTDDQKQRWTQALADVADLAGEHLQKKDEASMIEKIANDVSNKLVTKSNDCGDLVGIEAHLKALRSLLCLESEEAKMMVGIVGTSGIGKSTIGRALYSQLSSQFPHHAFGTYKSTNKDVICMKLSWEKEFLSEILGQKDIKIDHVGEVKQRLNHKKVLIVLDDVDDLELLKTLVGKTEWFGPGSRIIVITQDRQLLKAHKIDVIYTVEFPSKDLALKMLCRSAFEQDSPPDGFMELAVEVAKLAGNLPLGLSVLGSSLKERDKDEWMEMMPRLRNDLDGNIEKTLRVSYDRLNKKDRELFLCIACFFNGYRVSKVKDLLEDKVGLKTLTDKSLIRITPKETIEIHSLLEKLGREIDRAESKGNPGKRRFLENFEDIQEVFTDKSATETVLGIRLDTYLSIDENSFKGMRNLQYLVIYGSRIRSKMDLPQSLVYLPRKLRLLYWFLCPLKCLPSNFKAEYLVELKMVDSKLEKLWEGTQPLGSLKKMDMRWSIYLKEIPDLSNAINLEELDLSGCESLVILPSSIKNAIKLRTLNMIYCEKLESFPTDLNFESLEYLDLNYCPNLRNFPAIRMTNSTSWPHGIKIMVGDCLWNKNLPGLDYLDCLMRCMPCEIRPEHLKELEVKGNKTLEKLWEGVQSLSSLKVMDQSECDNLREIPDLSKATNLESLKLNSCKSLVTVPSTIGNLHKLVKLYMADCTRLEVLPTDVNLSSLKILNLSGCSSLRSFPQISWSIERLYLEKTAIEEVPCCIEKFSRLTVLRMYRCGRLKNISPNIFRLTRLGRADFSGSGGVITALNDASFVATMEDHFSCIPLYETIEKRRPGGEYEDKYDGEDEYKYEYVYEDEFEVFNFQNCFKLDRDARELIIRSCFKLMALPGGEVPMYFKHRAYGDSLTVILPQSFISQKLLRFKVCVVVDLLTKGQGWRSYVDVSVRFNGIEYFETLFEDGRKCKTDLLILCSFKFQPTDVISKLASNDVEFEFFSFKKIKECGVQLLKIKADSGGSSETEPPNDSDGSKKQMRMTSGTSEEYIVADTGLDALNLELSLGQREASSVSSYPCLEGKAFSIITEQQDEVIPIWYPLDEPGN